MYSLMTVRCLPAAVHDSRVGTLRRGEVHRDVHSACITMFAVNCRYFADMIIGLLRNEAASVILRGLDVSAEPAAPTDMARVPEPMFEGGSCKPWICSSTAIKRAWAGKQGAGVG